MTALHSGLSGKDNCKQQTASPGDQSDGIGIFAIDHQKLNRQAVYRSAGPKRLASIAAKKKEM
jgi:hypothetical protein